MASDPKVSEGLGTNTLAGTNGKPATYPPLIPTDTAPEPQPDADKGNKK